MLFRKILLLGILLGLTGLGYVLQVTAKTNSSTPPVQKQEISQEKQVTLSDDEPIRIAEGFTTPFSLERPLRVIIPQVNIDLTVVESEIIDGHWEVSEQFANHGMGSAYPGQIGNMVMFAHARPHLFLDLQNVTVGDDIYVLTDKKWFVYTVSAITQVTPDQVEVIAPTSDERVTLFTCSGFADENRFIVVGKRKQLPDSEVIRKIY